MRKKIFLSIIGFLATCVYVWAQQADSKFILNVNGTAYQPQANAQAFIAKKSSSIQSLSLEEDRYLVMQFKELPKKQEMEMLEKQGIKLVSYLQNNAYYVVVSPTKSAKKYSSLDNLYSVFSTNELNKKHLAINAKNEIPEHAKTSSGELKLTVFYYKNVSEETVKNAVQQIKHSDFTLNPLFGSFAITIDSSLIKTLELIPWITFIGLKEPDPVLFNEMQLKDTSKLFDDSDRRVSGLQLYNQKNGNPLTGKGVTVGIWDGNVEEHIDLKGRVTVNQQYMETSAYHGLHVAGILAGSGVKDVTAMGMAPEAILQAYNFSVPNGVKNRYQEMVDAYFDKDMVISQNSYGVSNGLGIKYWYSTTSATLDMISNMCPELLIVFASGNSSSATTPWATVSNVSKNALFVGNITIESQLSISSSRGSDLTGVITPQVCAVGTDVWSLSEDDRYASLSGTSMSCPFVSGMAALVHEKYEKIHNGERPISSLVKGLIANGAEDLLTPGPDFATGYGEVSVLNTMEMLDKKQYFVGNVANTGDYKEYTVYVPENVHELKVMLTWNDPYSQPVDVNALINNLDLEVKANRTYLPLVPDAYFVENPAVEKVDNINTIEQVVIKSPAAGNITIRIKGSALPVPDQQFSMVYSFKKKGITLLGPVEGESANTDGQMLMKWVSTGLSGDITVEISQDGGNTYQIRGKVDESINAIGLNPIREFRANNRLRISQGGMFSESAVFAYIGRVDSLELNTAANKLTWAAVAGITNYEILRLKEDNRLYEAVAETGQLEYTIPSNLLTRTTYFTVRAKRDSTIGQRAIAVEVCKPTFLSQLPIKVDFEQPTPDIRMTDGAFSGVQTKYIPEHNTNVLMFMGRHMFYDDSYRANWQYINANNADQAWAINPKYISSAKFNVNLPAGKKFLLKLKLRVRSTIQYHAFFRLAVNGTVIPDAGGNLQQIHPFIDDKLNAGFYNYTVYSPKLYPAAFDHVFVTRYYNLADYEGLSNVEISLDGLCATGRYMAGNDPFGAQIYVDDIEIVEPKAVELVVTAMNPEDIYSEFHEVTTTTNTKQGTKEIKAKIVNIGSSTYANTGNAEMRVDYGSGRTSTVIQKPLPPMAPWALQEVSFGDYSFFHPENHNFTFTIAPSDENVITHSHAVKHINSYWQNGYYLQSPGGPVQTPLLLYGDVETVIITDWGTSIYPYYKAENTGVTLKHGSRKRIKLELTELDMDEGDTLYINTGKTIEKRTGQNVGLPILSENFDGSLYISTTTKGGPMHGRGWMGNLTTAPKSIAKDLEITSATFTLPKVWGDSITMNIHLANNGADAVDLDFPIFYQINGQGKVTETSTTFYASFEGSASYEITSLESGMEAIALVTIKTTGLTLNQQYPIALGIELADENTQNNTFSSSFLYGEQPFIDDVDNAYIAKFKLNDYTYTTTSTNGRIDNSSIVLPMELGKSYPMDLLADGVMSPFSRFYIYVDTNKNSVFEEHEAKEIKANNPDNPAIYSGQFSPHTYVFGPGNYGFRVKLHALVMTGSGIFESTQVQDYTLSLTGNAVTEDITLTKLDCSTKLSANIQGDALLTIERFRCAASETPVTIKIDFMEESTVKNSQQIGVLPLKNDIQKRSLKFITPALPQGTYTMRVTVMSNDNIPENNVMTKQVSISEGEILYSTSTNGNITYASPLLSPNLASVIRSSYAPFEVSNMNDATWVIDSVAGVDNWFLLSEQFLRKWDNKMFYENKLVRFNIDPATYKGSYTPLATSFNTASIHAIAFDAKNKKLYGLGKDNGSAAAAIYTIDYTTGAASLAKVLSATDSSYTGLTASPDGKLFTVNKTSNYAVMIDVESGVTLNYCKLSATPAERVNLYYDANEAELFLGFEDKGQAMPVNVLHKADPKNNTSLFISTFGQDNQPYSLAMRTKIRQEAEQILRLDRFEANGQVYSLIDNETKTVNIILPPSIDITALQVTYRFANGNAKFFSGATEQNPDNEVMNISSPLSLMAKSATTEQNWTITVSSPLTGIQLTSFSFLKVHNPDLLTDITATIDGQGVSCTVPYNIELSSLVPAFTTNVQPQDERVSILGTVVKSGINTVDFSNPAILNLKAIQARFEQNYAVNVIRDLCPEHSLIDFGVQSIYNPMVSSDIAATITGDMVALIVPPAVSLSSLIPSFTVSPRAKLSVSNIGQDLQSGINMLNLSSPVGLTVSAEDGSTAAYTLTARKAGSEAFLLTFTLTKANNASLQKDITGEITGNKVTLRIPREVALTELMPTFTSSTFSTLRVVGTTQALVSGLSTLNFGTTLTLEVVPEAGNTNPYAIEVVSGDVTTEPVVEPNPADTYTFVVGASGSKGQLYDAQGRLISSMTIDSDRYQLDLSGLPAGMYFLRLDKNNNETTVKILKK